MPARSARSPNASPISPSAPIRPIHRQASPTRSSYEAATRGSWNRPKRRSAPCSTSSGLSRAESQKQSRDQDGFRLGEATRQLQRSGGTGGAPKVYPSTNAARETHGEREQNPYGPGYSGQRLRYRSDDGIAGRNPRREHGSQQPRQVPAQRRARPGQQDGADRAVPRSRGQPQELRSAARPWGREHQRGDAADDGHLRRGQQPQGPAHAEPGLTA